MCGECGQTAKSHHGLRKHLTVHKDLPRDIAVCAFCGEKFVSEFLLYNHVLQHLRNGNALPTQEEQGKARRGVKRRRAVA